MKTIEYYYYKFHGPHRVTSDQAKELHDKLQGYRLLGFLNQTLYLEITIHADLTVEIRYYDKDKRMRWLVGWFEDKDKINKLDSVYCFTFNIDNQTSEENYKSHFYNYNDDDSRKDLIRYFHLKTSKTVKITLDKRRKFNLPKPEFGKYQEYLEFPYQELFPELEQWPLDIFPANQQPQKNIPIPKIIL